MNKNTSAIKDIVYNEVEKSLDTSKGKAGYKKCISDFISVRGNDIYDTLPCSRIYFRLEDEDALFKALNIDKSIVNDALKKTYYSDIPSFNPKAATEPFPVAQLSVIRYFYLKNMKKEFEISMIHLAFSGKFYPSRHYRSFPRAVPARYVMEYVVNNRLTQKYDIISAGSIFGAMKSICTTWINTYESKLKKFNDDDVVYLIQQLHSRIGSFMKNLAEEYYKVYNDKDAYMTYDFDSHEEGDYHIADSISLRVQRYVEKTINTINTIGVDFKICKMCSDNNIKPMEVQSIMESLLSESDNISTIKELLTLLILCYFNFGGGADIRDLSFISYSIQAKPNAKQKEIVRIKEIIEEFLTENSPSYLRRRSRMATKNSYERAVKMYFTLAVHNANR